MPMPGWYPDPAGTPGQFRYWDGAAWSQETTANPASSAPTHAAAPRPVGSTQPHDPTQPLGPTAALGSSSQPAPAPAQRKRGGTLLAVLAGLVVLALLVWGLFFRGNNGFTPVPEDTNSASPTGPVWNETAPPTPEPNPSESDPAPEGGSLVSCPTGGGGTKGPENGRLSGGGLVIPELQGWEGAGSMFDLPWTHDLAAQTQVVHTSGGFGGHSWFSVQAVGALSVADGFEEPRRSAQMMMSCFATSGYYQEFTGRKDITGEPVSIAGHKGWHLRTEVYVDMPDMPQVEGDVIDVVVVDTGSPESLGVFVSSATIGDTGRQQQVDASRAAMTVG